MKIRNEFGLAAANDNGLYYWPPIDFEAILASTSYEGPSWDDPSTWHLYDGPDPYYKHCVSGEDTIVNLPILLPPGA